MSVVETRRSRPSPEMVVNLAGTAIDLTVSELAVEAFFPANMETAEGCERPNGDGPPAPAPDWPSRSRPG